ncbi:glycosyltransferase family 2 protein [Nocardiopsis changdeensis]|uniref:Glycosyltransferase family 2 protein n=1 Tax=Nocardiopsis changdeensis TaxID=2831969 RepID=A0ABX8BIR4_9ACTN|nr:MULTISPECIES: glycosyltransferase family 2 protein [Nocardiopsis]QUX22145.1 glycosyltransferase family 2 protein [Nocardiopsis changdeensis]QYX38084.1 glycosyltransferase [Nocardiopsis sp. MT53]
MTALSVIIPAKDVAPYIGTALSSLARNHHPDFEYIVVDDGSTDGTGDIVESHHRTLPGLRMIRNETPAGPSEARNQALAMASGRYITYLDGDDWLAPGYLSRALAAIRDLDVDFVKTDHVQVYGAKRLVHHAPEGRINRPLDPRAGIMPANCKTMVDYPYAWSGVFDRERLTDDLMRFEPALHSCEDRLWTWQLHLKAKSYARVPEIGVFYRRLVSDSLTQVGDQRQLHFLDAFAQLIEQVSTTPGDEGFLPKAARSFCAILTHHIELEDRLTRELRREMSVRGTAMMRALPEDLLDRTLREMGGKRAKRLRTFWGAA